MKIRSVKINFLLNALNTCIGFLFPLITFPYVSRILTATGYGSAEYAIQTVTFFSLFALLGVNIYGTRECAKVRDDIKALSKITQELLLILLISTTLVCFIYALSIAFIPNFRAQATLFAIAGLSLPCTALGVQWFLNANEQYLFMAIRTTLAYIFIIVCMFLFVHDSNDVIVWTSISLGATALGNIAGFLYMKKNTHFKGTGKLEIKKHFKPMALFFLTTAATSIYTSLDAVMLGTMTNTEEVGYYQVAVKIKNILVAVMSALAAVIIPRVSYYVSQKNEQEIKNLVSATVHFALIYAPYAIAIIGIFASAFIGLLAGDGYTNSILLLQVMLPAFFFICLSLITSQELMVPFGFEKHMTISYICAGIIDLVLNVVLIPLIGALGAAIATTIAEIFVFFYQSIILCRSIPLKEYCSGIKKILLPQIFSISTVIIIANLSGYSLLGGFIAAILGGLVLVIALLINRESLAVSVLQSVLSKVKNKSTQE